MSVLVETQFARDADALLSDESFVAAWRSLQDACPWATACQSPEFCRAWYRSYRSQFDPLLVMSRDNDGRLQGLLTLAVEKSRRTLSVAGAWQAEYQVWLALPELADTFPPAAVRAAWRYAARGGLQFQYVPPLTPMQWLEADRASPHSVVATHRRPILTIGDGKQISQSLAKRGNKGRLNRMERIGPIDFHRVRDEQEMSTVFDSICTHYDLRHLAMRGSAPFRNDKFKRAFHLEMMRERGLLHLTVLKVGSHLAAANIGTCERTGTQLGLITHNPIFAAQSPGKFLILFLAKLLAQEGVPALDLTAGGDSYKERFATDWDEVKTLRLFRSAWSKHRSIAGARARTLALGALSRMRVRSNRASAALRSLAQAGPREVLRSTRRIAYSRLDVHPFLSRGAGPDRAPHLSDQTKRDELEHLLTFHLGRQNKNWPTEHRFVAASIARLEEGGRFYSQATKGGLQRIGWLFEKPPEPLRLFEGDLPLVTEPGSAVIDLCALPHPGGDAHAMLRLMLADAHAIPKIDSVRVLVRGDDPDALDAARTLGLAAQPAIRLTKMFGRRRVYPIVAPRVRLATGMHVANATA